MVLLENARLPTITFNNVVSTLIAAARINPASTEKYHQISSTKLTALKGILTTLMDFTKDQGTEEANVTSETNMNKLNTQEVRECHKTIENILNPCRFVMTEKSEGCFIRLKDAVTAIKDLQTEIQKIPT